MVGHRHNDPNALDDGCCTCNMAERRTECRRCANQSELDKCPLVRLSGVHEHELGCARHSRQEAEHSIHDYKYAALLFIALLLTRSP